MKIPFVFCLAILLTSSTYAWTSRPQQQPQPPKAVVTRHDFFQSLLVGAVVAVPIVTNAAPFDPATFSHQYNDPKHPNCKRIVVVKPDGTVNLSGTDGTPGCPEDGSGNVWRLVGEVEGDKILVDFSPKVWMT